MEIKSSKIIRAHITNTIEWILGRKGEKFTEKNLEQNKAINRVSELVKDGKSFILCGPTGVGKTILAQSCIRVFSGLLDKQFNRIEADNMIYCLKPEEGYLAFNSHLNPYFFIDDLGRELVKYIEFGQEIKPFETIVNQRYERCEQLAGESILIITTNLLPQDISERYGSRVLSRLVEMCEFIEITGEDLRYTKLKK